GVAVLQMFSHGIIAGLLFAVVGRMVYDRTHTRDLSDLQQMNLSKLLPFAAVTFTIAGVASMGLPGFSGFVAELQVLIGAWRAFPTFAVLGGLGVLIGVAYTLRAIQQAFFSDTVRSARTAALSRAQPRERATEVAALGQASPAVVADVDGSNPFPPAPEARVEAPHHWEPISVPERIG